MPLDMNDANDAEQPLIDDLNAVQRVTWGEFLKPFIFLGWAAFGAFCVDLGQGSSILSQVAPPPTLATFKRHAAVEGNVYRAIYQIACPQLFVERYRWLTSGIFVELLALGQCLPGPTSTQMAFAIGVSKKGVTGGLTSGATYATAVHARGTSTRPSQVSCFSTLACCSCLSWAWASEAFSPTPHPWSRVSLQVGNGYVLHTRAMMPPHHNLNTPHPQHAGLSVTGVALVASAAKSLISGVCKTRLLAMICATSAILAYYHNTAWLFPTLLVGVCRAASSPTPLSAPIAMRQVAGW